MATSVQQAYSDSVLLTIPNVRVRVHVQARPTVLGEDGRIEFFARDMLLGSQPRELLLGSQPGSRPRVVGFEPREMLPGSQEAKAAFVSLRKRLAQRNWRTIRNALVNLDLENASAICKWLGSAGYVAKAILTQPTVAGFSDEDMLRMSVGSSGWEPHHLTDNIRTFVKETHDLVLWLMTLDKKAFREAIRTAREFAEEPIEIARAWTDAILRNQEPPKLKDPGMMFLREVGAPEGIDSLALGLALRGSGTSESLVAQLRWDDDGSPTVMVFPANPVEAICLSVHIDRDFSRRRFVSCIRCGKWLEQIRGRDRFCSDGCRNYVTTMERRAKIRFLVAAQESWEALSPQKKRVANRWKWIAASARRKSKWKYAIEPSWAEQELTKLKRRKRIRRDH